MGHNGSLLSLAYIAALDSDPSAVSSETIVRSPDRRQTLHSSFFEEPEHMGLFIDLSTKCQIFDIDMFLAIFSTLGVTHSSQRFEELIINLTDLQFLFNFVPWRNPPCRSQGWLTGWITVLFRPSVQSRVTTAVELNTWRCVSRVTAGLEHQWHINNFLKKISRNSFQCFWAKFHKIWVFQAENSRLKLNPAMPRAPISRDKYCSHNSKYIICRYTILSTKNGINMPYKKSCAPLQLDTVRRRIPSCSYGFHFLQVRKAEGECRRMTVIAKNFFAIVCASDDFSPSKGYFPPSM
jgi:hypothetical protein